MASSVSELSLLCGGIGGVFRGDSRVSAQQFRYARAFVRLPLRAFVEGLIRKQNFEVLVNETQITLQA